MAVLRKSTSHRLEQTGIMFWVHRKRGDSDWDWDSAVRVFTSAQGLSTSVSTSSRAMSLSPRNRSFSIVRWATVLALSAYLSDTCTYAVF